MTWWLGLLNLALSPLVQALEFLRTTYASLSWPSRRDPPDITLTLPIPDRRDEMSTGRGRSHADDDGPSGQMRGGEITSADRSSARQSAGQKPPEFLFRLHGDKVRGALVEAATGFALRFEYSNASPLDALVMQGGELTRAVAQDLDLEVAIYPGQLTIVDGRYVAMAQFRGGALTNEVSFALHAPEAVDDAAVHVFFSVNGCCLYDFPLRIRVVEDLEAVARVELQHVTPRLDLDAYVQARSNRAPRQARLVFKSSGPQITVTFHELNRARPRNFANLPLTEIDAGRWTNLLKRVALEAKEVAGRGFWNEMAEPLACTPETDADMQASLRQARNRVISAGAFLYTTLAKDMNLSTILGLIDELPPGSGISVFSNCGFLPLEILYPRAYHYSNVEEPTAARLWGYRFHLEYFLWEGDVDHRYPSAPAQSGQPFVSMNLDPWVDAQLTRDGARVPPFLPVKSHAGLLSDRMSVGWRTEWNQKFSEIVKTLKAPHEATLLYYYCHGRADTPFSSEGLPMLAFGADAIDPNWIQTDQRFRHAPIVVLNSCASGEASPLSLLTFLERFRQKGAAGVVSTSFAVPMLFAAAFGRTLVARYANGEALGDILYQLRRQLLDHDNPLGLFYALQCPMDLKAPAVLSGSREAA